jgi:8-oxo-dGTP pyrophosphatase MutT (NUDIX family)
VDADDSHNADKTLSVHASVLARLRAGISGLVEIDARTGASKRRCLAELDRLDRPFDQHADPVHFTASAALVGPRGVVLHRHKRLGVWLLPGGHIDDGERPWETALREADEETGIHASHPGGTPLLFHIDVLHAARGHTHLDLRYLLTAWDEDCAPAPGESQHCRWFRWDEAFTIADAGLLGALRLAHRLITARSSHSAE